MNDIKFKKKKKNKSKSNKLKFIFIVIFIISVTVIFIVTMNNDRFFISSLNVEGNNTILDIDIIKSVNEITDRKKFFIPMNNVLFLNKRRIISKLEKEFPKIYNIKIIIKNGSDLFIYIKERSPYSLWCKYNDKNKYSELVYSDFNEECYFSDQNGFIYTEAPYFSSGIFEKIYITDKSLAVGIYILDKERFDVFFDFIKSLNDKFGISVNYIVLDIYGDTRIYINSLLRKKILNNPYIIYHTDDDYNLIERNMDLMVSNDLFKRDFSIKPDKLNFIDLRITDQIRYKFGLNNSIHD